MVLGAATTFNQATIGMRSIVSGFDEPCNVDFLALYGHNGPPATLAEIEMWENYFL